MSHAFADVAEPVAAIVPPADRVRRFCTTILNVLSGPAAEPFAALFGDDLARLLGEGSRNLTAGLRREVELCEATLAQLDLLAESRLFGSAGTSPALRAELLESRNALRQMLATFDALHPAAACAADDCQEPIVPPPSDADRCVLQEEAGELIPEYAPLASDEDESAIGEVTVPSADDTSFDGHTTTSVSDEASATARRAQSCLAQAERHRHQEEYDEAEALYAQAMRLDPQLREAYIRRGTLSLLRGDADGAIDYFTAALGLGPELAELYALRGDASATSRRFDDAVTDYHRALELDPRHVRARFNLAVAYRLLGESRKALAELERVLQLRPSHAAAYYNRGLIYLQAGLHDQAIAEFTAALKHDPKHADARQRMGQAIEAQRAAQPEVSAPAAKPPTKVQQPKSEASRLEVKCPRCGEAGFVDWARLDKVITCSVCGGSFGVRADGATVEVARARDGRWIEAARLRLASRQKRARRRLLLAVIAAAVLVPILGFVTWRVARPVAIAGETELPLELKSRAEIFAQAWLRNDVRLMRRLTSPAYERILYSWYTRHRPSAALEHADKESSLSVAAISTKSKPPLTEVRIRISGSGSPTEFTQHWEERGGTWYFVPPAR